MYRIGVPRIIPKFTLRGDNHYIAAADETDGVMISFIVNYNTRSRLCTWHKHPLYEFDKGRSIQVGIDLLVFLVEKNPMPVVRYSNVLQPRDVTKTNLKEAGVGREYFSVAKW